MIRVALFAVMLLPFVHGSNAAGKDLDYLSLQQSIQRVVEEVRSATVAVAMSRRGPVVGAFSAVIVTPEGHVLTAGHAVEPGRNYRVVLSDGRQVSAKGLGKEDTVDCGLIKITEPGPWPYAEMGWSATLKKNQPCLSFGHPGPYDSERGPVLRFGRIVEPVSPRNGFIQTTCLMEPGDSGGPLFDWNGRVIGVHSMIEESLDVNYEVPVDQFRRFWSELNLPKTFLANRVVSGPQFGMTLSRRGRGRGRGGVFQGWGRGRGIVASEVSDGSPAAEAGIQQDDRIVAIGGERISSASQLDRLLYNHFVLNTETVEIGLERGGQDLMVQLAIPQDKTASQQTEPKVIRMTSPTDSPIPPIAELENLSDHFTETESRLDRYCAVVTSTVRGQSKRALATVLSSDHVPAPWKKRLANDSLLVSKSSLVGADPTIRFGDATTTIASVVARDREHDLLLMKVHQRVQVGVELDSADATTQIVKQLGVMLVTPRPDGDGLISVLGSALFTTEKQREAAGFLGVRPDTQDDRVVLTEIYPNTAAARAKLEKGDVVLSIDEIELRSPDQMIQVLSTHLPGDTIRVRGVRDEEEFNKDIVLGERSDISLHAADRFAGGKSKRRDGFPSVFSHDARLRPNECGGPLFSLDGNFLGINIARASRTRSYAVPAFVVKTFVGKALEEELVPPAARAKAE